MPGTVALLTRDIDSSPPADVCNVETNGTNGFPILLTSSAAAGCMSHDEEEFRGSSYVRYNDGWW
jgi:hypothetical protein